MLKKFMATMLAASLLLMATACGGTTGTTSTTTAQPGGTTTTGESTTGDDTTTGGETTTEGEETTTGEVNTDVKTYTFLHAWNGGAAAFPFGFEDGSVAKLIEGKTGVRLNVETIVSSEKEKLAQIFASGLVPDITNAPHWSTNPGGEGELIKDAAAEGMLLGLNGLYEDFPNVDRMMNEGVSDLYLSRDLNHPDYDGERYVIPQQTPRRDEDVRNWAYNVWVRGDILSDLGHEQADIDSSEALYDLLVEIKNGDYTDINGNPIIPSGAWHNGWNYGDFLDSFTDGTMTGWNLEDGQLVNDMFSDLQEDRILYMRKLITEGLFDPEALTHTDTQAKEKAVTGRVAVLNAHYPHVYGFFASTLYIDNPEMKYVPVGPLKNAAGEVNKGYERHGRTGSPVIFFSADIEEPERALGFIDYINSDEGLVTVLFGIEGTHHTMVDGIPTLTDEWKEIQTTDSNKWHLEGFGLGNFIGADPSIGNGWDANYMEEGYVEAREFAPMEFFEGTTVDQLTEMWEGRPAYDTALSTINWGDEEKKAFLAESDEKALEILENYRKRLMDAGIEEMTEYVNDAYADDDTILY